MIWWFIGGGIIGAVAMYCGLMIYLARNWPRP